MRERKKREQHLRENAQAMRRQVEREKEEEQQYREGRIAAAKHRQFINHRERQHHGKRSEVTKAREEVAAAAGGAHQDTATASAAGTNEKRANTAKVKPTIMQAKVFISTRRENTRSMQDINEFFESNERDQKQNR